VSRFFCRHCHRGAEATAPPDGWLRVQVRDAEQERRDGRLYVTRGLYCGAACLAAEAAAWAEAAAVTP
jgi:hypothetical protein